MKTGLFIVGQKGLDVLKAVHDKIDLQFVMTYKDKMVKDTSYESIISFCKINNIKCYQSKKLPSTEYKNIDKIFVIGWQFLLKDHMDKLIVIHDAALPELKGWSPTVNYLIEGYPYLAATALQPTEVMDTGDIYACRKRDIKYPMKIKEALNIICELYVEIVLEICLTNPTPKPMIGEESFCIWRNELDYLINWYDSAAKIKRMIDALGDPFDGASISLPNDIILKVKESKIIKGNIIEQKKHVGKIFKLEKGIATIICGKNMIELSEVIDLAGETYYFNKLKQRL